MAKKRNIGQIIIDTTQVSATASQAPTAAQHPVILRTEPHTSATVATTIATLCAGGG